MMKKAPKLLMTLLVGLLLHSPLFAQNFSEVPLSPKVQHATWEGKKAFDNTTTFQIYGGDSADQDAVAQLRSGLFSISHHGIQLYIGERGSEVLSPLGVEQFVPQHPQGYYLEVTPSRVVIAGYDGVGTFYGVQTFLQLMQEAEVPAVKIVDFPSIPARGMIEGFYGNPFSHKNRLNLFRFFGQQKINYYIYGPKDDPYHGFGNKWREPYPEADAARIAELVREAHAQKVNFVWAVHPGNFIQWTDEDGDGVIDDFVAARRKFELMYDLGVRAFAVFFDDIGKGVGRDPVHQAKLMNYLTDEFVLKKGDVQPLLLCPTQYNKAWSSGDYLRTLGEELHESVQVMWTGATVVDMINREDMEWINEQIGRKAFIWLNYPVTDYCVDHLLMGPLYGNDTDIAELYSGFCANPMEYAEASKVALFSTADYTWNTPAYDALDSWERALRYLMPKEKSYKAFKVFCENNIDLGPTGHQLRRVNESVRFKAVSEPFLNWVKEGLYDARGVAEVREQFVSFRQAMNDLAIHAENRDLLQEINPWMEVFGLMAHRGQELLKAYEALHKGRAEEFVESYKKVKSLEEQQSKIRSRDFEGSIKNPRPMPANEVVAPFLKELEGTLVAQYKERFDYALDIFPVQVLEDGFYFIKVADSYLTSVRGESVPQLRAERDMINPQRQVWEIRFDHTMGRYSIRNAEDNRYINELGIFGRYPYEASWHTYVIAEKDGKYAIQNGGDAGKNYWTVKGERIQKGESDTAEYLFDISPAK